MYRSSSSFLTIRLFIIALTHALLLPQPCYAAYNYIPFNISLTDLSPVIKWGIARVDPGWTVDFSNVTDGNRSMASYTPWNSPSNYTGPVGVGVSGHSARPSPAGPGVLAPQLVLRVDATAVYIHGMRDPDSDGPPEVELSYVLGTGNETFAPRPSNGMLLALDRLTFGLQNLVIKFLDPNRMFTVRAATFETQILSNASSWEDIPVSYENFVLDGGPNPRFIVANSNTSQWHSENRKLAVDGGPSMVSELVAGGAATITVPIPLGTAFVLLNGTVGPDRGEALINWNPLPPNFPDWGWSFNSSCPSAAPAVLYTKQLNPDVKYNLTIQTLSSELYNITDIGLHMLTYYSASNDVSMNSGGQDPSTGSGSREDSSTAKIVGGVIGGILGALLVTAIAVFVLTRRRRAKASAQQQYNAGFEPVPFMQEVDGGSLHSVSDSPVNQRLPPSYNPQWSERVRNERPPDPSSTTPSPAMPITSRATTVGLAVKPPPSKLEAALLSPGIVSPTAEPFSIAAVPKASVAGAGAESNTSADYKKLYLTRDYKAPYIAGAFERLDSRQPEEGGEVDRSAQTTPTRVKRPLPSPTTAPRGGRGPI